MNSKQTPMANSLKNKRFFKWLKYLFALWLIPTFLFIGGIALLETNVEQRQNTNLWNNLKDNLDELAYRSSYDQFFEPKLRVFFSQIKGLSGKSDQITKVINGFANSFGKDVMDIYIFNGKGKIYNTPDSRIEFEHFFKLINSDIDAHTNIPEIILENLSTILPFPTYALKEVRGQKGNIVNLGNPDRYSLCYFNKSASIKSDLIGGILVFIHFNKLEEQTILNKSIISKNPKKYGYININGKSCLPTILSDRTADELISYYNLHPHNKFILGSKLVVLKRLDDRSLLLAASPVEKVFLPSKWIAILIFILLTIGFMKISYTVIVNRENINHGVRVRLISILVICISIPLTTTFILAKQFLREYKFEIKNSLKRESFKKLSTIDNAFKRFITHKLLECRKVSNNLTQVIEQPIKLKQTLDKLYRTFSVDSLHLIASAGNIIYSNELITAEIRRHYFRDDKYKKQLYSSWQERQANITPRHLELLFSGPNNDALPYVYHTQLNKTLSNLLKYTSISVLDYYNKSHGISTGKRSAASMVINAMSDGKSQSFIQSAKSNIQKFAYMQGLDEVHLAYTDIFPGPEKEAWYVLFILIDMANMERQFLEHLYSKNNTDNLVETISANNDIRAISLHQFAMNFPSIFEFRTFSSLFKRQSGQLRTLSQEMDVGGVKSIVNAIKCSYLQHYMLIDVKPFSLIQTKYNKIFNIIILCFIAALIFAGIISRLIINTLSTPIEAIDNEINAIFQKNFSDYFPDLDGKEFAYIGKNFHDSANILKDINIAEKIRADLMPTSELICGGYHVLGNYSPGNLIVGDFYDYFSLKNGASAIIMTEVSGDDIEATYLIAMIKIAFSIICPKFPTKPAVVMEKLNKLLIPYRAKGHTITCLIAYIDPVNEKATCVNAGFNYPALSSNNTCEFKLLPSTPLGISPETSFVEQTINIQQSNLVFYSGGVWEIQDKLGNKLSSESLLDIVSKNSNQSKRNPEKNIMNALKQYSNNKTWRKDVSVIIVHSTL